ncbi:hypothetical protein CU098_013648 [Rhizopus stolonifer]|uniref:Uncharacterized protein n=1 Tax=Rhizopus stolonifer TaxID=4846 RepID=A0A367KVG2_RHIST|nr:hypothetical protein CU098_013648 [Rhizopus stolonifer]
MSCWIKLPIEAKASQEALYANVAIVSTAQVALFMRTMTTSSCRMRNNTRQLFINNLELLHQFSQTLSKSKGIELINTCSHFWTRTLMERYEGNWKYLNTLQYPSDNDEIEHYSYLALTMRDTIKQLKICNTLSYTRSTLNIYQSNILKKKPDF